MWPVRAIAFSGCPDHYGVGADTGVTPTWEPTVNTAVKTRTAIVAAGRPLTSAGLEAVVAAGSIDIAASVLPMSLVSAVAQHMPDMVVVAIAADDGDPFTEIARVMAIHPACAVLAITETASVIELREAIVAGVQSLLLSDTSIDELRDAIVATAQGTRVLAPEVALQLAGSWAAEPANGDPQLTARELQVLQLLAEGMTNSQVASELDLSPRTVKTHVQNLLVKLDTPDRTGAVAQGFRRCLIS
jgi:DNA-binding NarL/FixJ family response regulator